MGDARSKADGDARWSSPEPGMYVASIGSVTLGYVIEVPQGFVAFDADARPILRSRTLRAARATVLARTRTQAQAQALSAAERAAVER